ncbi:GumC family protein [Acidisoma sp.]|uniref:GumC family protein n=1 Tax=Acidisoma sp. TaxID=1872115 RepID=UPI003B001C82
MLDDADGRGPSHFARSWENGTDARGPAASEQSVRGGAELIRGVVARQLWTIVIPMLLMPALGFVAVSRMPLLYTATGTVIYDPAGYAPEVLQSILKTDPTTDAVVASQGAILASLSIAHRVSLDLDLGHQPGFTSRPHSSPAARSLLLDAQVLRSIAVVPINDSRVFAVSFTARNPMIAAAVTNRIMDLYLADQLGFKTAALRAANDWMENRAVSLRVNLLAQEAAIARYRQQNGLIAGVQAGMGTEELSTLGDDLMRAENDLAAARARRDVSADGAGMSQNVITIRLQEAQAQANLDAALGHLGPNHPEVRALRKLLGALQAAAGAETSAARSGVMTDAQAAQTRLTTLQNNLLTLQKESAREAEADVPLQAMGQDADATRMLLQTLLSRMDQTTQQEAIETPDSRILSRAEPPAKPSSPHGSLLLAASALAGLVTGAALAWARETMATSFRSEAEVHAILRLPCIGAIPPLRAPLGLNVGGGGGQWMEALAREGTTAARQLAQLRGRLRLAAACPRLLAITSVRPGEGKSSLALALARSAARAGERVLLVDCDLWRRNLSRIMGAADLPGLGELLADRGDTQSLVHADGFSGLAFLPAGRPQDGRGIGHLSVKISTEGWRRDYDLVVLDGPPILASADALVLAEMAEGILLCIRWNHTPRRLAAHVRGLLGPQTGRSLGVVLTQVGTRSRALRGFPEAEIASRRYAAYATDSN